MGPFRTLTLAAAVLAGASAGASDRFEFSRSGMGTTLRIVLYATDSVTGAAAAARAFGELDAVEAALSDYRTDSEIARLGAAAGGPALAVSPVTVAALRAARGFADQTGGA